MYGIVNRRCNAIFAFCADDCFSAPTCNDIPGVWRSTIDWWNDGIVGNHLQYYYPDGSFRTSDGFRGVWWRELNTVTFQILNGDCEPIIYTAQISDTARLMLDGTMSCTGNGAYGSWYADKTNSALPAQAMFRDGETPKSGPADGSGLATERAPQPVDSSVNPPPTKVQK
ncbi:MAG: hypothetical protein HYX75_17545 [Acidobacteria bacterium]|nr:hypothetical protein [Acidobacteriota bacterium]